MKRILCNECIFETRFTHPYGKETVVYIFENNSTFPGEKN